MINLNSMLPSRDSGCKGSEKLGVRSEERVVIPPHLTFFTKVFKKKRLTANTQHPLFCIFAIMNEQPSIINHQLSILIPTYNDDCRELVASLQQQADYICGLEYEILVADDGSTDLEVAKNNAIIGQKDHCTYLRNEQNHGRSYIRNFLAKNARHNWLLFIDGDMKIQSPEFLLHYLDNINEESQNAKNNAQSSMFKVLYGGYTVSGTPQKGNLRYCYEKKCLPMHTAEKRRLEPYKDFHTSNFMVPREVMLRHPLDERFHHYGYEDVLWGKNLQQNNIPILHIDNPVVFADFEDNPSFVSKTEEGLRTLHQFSTELEDYSRLIPAARKLGLLRPVVKLIYSLFRPVMRQQLCGKHPSLTLFTFYRLGYYLSL